MLSEQEMLTRLVQWAENQPSVRVLILTSTRAVPNATVDLLSDYDIILVATDILPFFEQRAWLEDFGSVLALYRDPLLTDGTFSKSGNIVQYEGGLKIDFTLWPVGLLQHIVSESQLPDELDAGYRVLIDKDHLTDRLKPPTYKAYIPTPPTETRYREVIEVFFVDTAYMAKCLWRDDIVAAKFILESMLRHEHLLPMLEWHMEIAHDWSLKPGPHGRRLKQWLRPDLWKRLKATYTGASPEANWEALFDMIALFRQAAVEVAAHLGFTYPHDLEQRAVAYLHWIKNLEKQTL